MKSIEILVKEVVLPATLKKYPYNFLLVAHWTRTAVSWVKVLGLCDTNIISDVPLKLLFVKKKKKKKN